MKTNWYLPGVAALVACAFVISCVGPGSRPPSKEGVPADKAAALSAASGSKSAVTGTADSAQSKTGLAVIAKSAGELSADNYDEKEVAPYDSIICWPRPKVIQTFNSFLPLKKLKIIDRVKAPNTVALLERELKGKYGFQFDEKASINLEICNVLQAKNENIFPDRKLDYTSIENKEDGFIISIRENGVAIVSSGNRGIYYALRALIQIMDYSTPGGSEPRVQCLDIIDYPDQERRFIDFMAFGSYPLEVIKEFIYKIVAGGRYNGVSFTLSNYFNYKSHPEVARKTPNKYLNTDELKLLADFCRENYIEVIPGLATPSHFYWATKSHPEFAELTTDVMCTRNPAAIKFVRELSEELIEACGGKGKVKYFSVLHDEVRWKPWLKDEVKIRDECPLCKDTPYRDIFLEYILSEHAWFKERGIRMLMCDDMFAAEHNGIRYGYDTVSLTEQIPKDIILVPWSSRYGYPSIPRWLKQGFNVLKSCTGYQHNAYYDKKVWGYMFNVTSSYPWLSYSRVPTSGNYYHYISILLYADLAWNNDSSVTVDEAKYFEANKQQKEDFVEAYEKGESLRLQKIFRYGNALAWKYNQERFPNESNKFAPVDLTKWANEDVPNLLAKANINDPQGWKTGVNKIADIPTDLGNRCILLDAKNNIVKNIAVNRKAGSLIFLHTVLAPEAPDVLWQKSGSMRSAAEFCLMGNYVVRYADGTETNIPIQYGYTTYNLRPPIHLRYPYKVRYVYKPFADRDWPEAISGRELTPGAPALYQYEWPNPHPEKVIVSLDFVSLEPAVCPALFAITVRE